MKLEATAPKYFFQLWVWWGLLIASTLISVYCAFQLDDYLLDSKTHPPPSSPLRSELPHLIPFCAIGFGLLALNVLGVCFNTTIDEHQYRAKVDPDYRTIHTLEQVFSRVFWSLGSLQVGFGVFVSFSLMTITYARIDIPEESSFGSIRLYADQYMYESDRILYVIPMFFTVIVAGAFSFWTEKRRNIRKQMQVEAIQKRNQRLTLQLNYVYAHLGAEIRELARMKEKKEIDEFLNQYFTPQVEDGLQIDVLVPYLLLSGAQEVLTVIWSRSSQSQKNSKKYLEAVVRTLNAFDLKLLQTSTTDHSPSTVSVFGHVIVNTPVDNNVDWSALYKLADPNFYRSNVIIDDQSCLLAKKLTETFKDKLPNEMMLGFARIDFEYIVELNSKSEMITILDSAINVFELKIIEEVLKPFSPSPTVRDIAKYIQLRKWQAKLFRLIYGLDL